jgi:putative transposase
MKALKLGFARQVLAGLNRSRQDGRRFDDAPERIWQHRFYDFNVSSVHKRVEKLRYIHRNPVKRGLVESPELWRWSSFRSYALGEPGAVRINQWDVLKLKRCTPAQFGGR